MDVFPNLFYFLVIGELVSPFGGGGGGDDPATEASPQIQQDKHLPNQLLYQVQVC
jgi:hypothetical protein